MVNLDNSDSDFEDIGGFQNDTSDDDAEVNDTSINNDQVRTNAQGKKVRGKDIDWLEFTSFPTAEEYKNSELLKKIKDEYSLNREREWDYGTVLVYTCKHLRRVEFIPCKKQLKVTYKSNSDEVTIETNIEGDDHSPSSNKRKQANPPATRKRARVPAVL